MTRQLPRVLVVWGMTAFSVCSHASEDGSLLHTAMRIPLLTQLLCIYNYQGVVCGENENKLSGKSCVYLKFLLCVYVIWL